MLAVAAISFFKSLGFFTMVRLSEIVTFGSCIGYSLGLQIPKRTATSPYINSTSTQVTSGISASGGQLCCYIFPQLVALNFWYTSSVSINNATVVTEYLQYNTTVVPTATITIPSNSTVDLGYYGANGGSVPILSGVPTDLAGTFYDGQYDATSVVTGSVYNDGVTTIASPTPFMAYSNVYVFPGQLNSGGTCMGSSVSVYPATTMTYTENGVPMTTHYSAVTDTFPGGVYAVETAASALIYDAGEGALGDINAGSVTYVGVSLSTPYYDTATSSKSWNNYLVDAAISPEMLSWLANNPSVLSIYPDITRCVIGTANGAPTVHIQVSLLTSTSARTVTTNAIYTKSGQSTPAAPASKTPSSIPVSMSTSKSVLLASTPQPISLSSDSSTPQASFASAETRLSPVPSSEQAPSDSTKDIPPSIGQEPVASSTSSDLPIETTAHVTVPTAESRTNAGGTQTPGSTQTQATNVQITQPAPTARVVETTEATSPPAVTVGSHVLSYASGSSVNVVVGSRSLTVGGSEVTVSGDTLSLASSGVVVVNGVSIPLEPQTSTTAPVVVFGSATATTLPSGGFVIESKTLSAGGPAVEISGTTYSVLPSGISVVANGESLAISTIAASAQTHVQIGGITAIPASSGVYVVEGNTLSPGGSAVEISGTTYSLPTSGSNVVVNGQTSQVSSFVVSETSPVLVGGITATPGSSGVYVAAGQTLSPGGSAVEISGTTYSLPATGENVVINGQTSAITSLVSPVVFGSATATPISSNAYIIAGQTLSPEGPAVTLSGTTYSLPTSGNSVFVNGSPTQISSVSPDVLTIGSKIYTPSLAPTALVIGSQTLIPGSVITIGSETTILPSTGSDFVVNGVTISLSTASGNSVLVLGSQTPSFSPLASGFVVAGQTLYAGGTPVTVGGETLSLSGSVLVEASGGTETTVGLGGYILNGIGGTGISAESGAESKKVSGTSSATSVGASSSGVGASSSGTEGGGTGAVAASTITGAAHRSGKGILWQRLVAVVILCYLQQAL